MATLAANQMTLFDVAKRIDPNGSAAQLAELLSQANDNLEDIVFKEGNLPTGHRGTIRTGLPTVYFRQINAGVPSSKSTTAQVDEGCALMEARSNVDEQLVKLNGNGQSIRQSEDMAFIEAMNQQQTQTMFYGNVAVDQKTYTGFSTRYSSLSAGNAANIINAQGAGPDNTSIWLIGWGENTIFCPYPKGSEAGLVHNDLGKRTIRDSNNLELEAWVSQFTWMNGLFVKDWRYAVRICNIDVSNLVTESSAADVIKLMSRAMDRIPAWGGIRPAFYMNRTVYSMLRIQALNKSANALAVEAALNQFGTPQKMMTFEGVPIRKVDQLLLTESLVA